ncbi:MAG TPA: ERF family protein [Treponemataceae bacterium]|nr:ERF family protein [Treponemataceae bacterium]
MKTSEQLNELFSALSKAQESIKNAQKEGYNPMFKSNYTTVTSVLDAVRPAYVLGISIMQMPEMDKLITRVGHSSGQWLEIETPLFVGEPKGMSKMQAYGNAVTYARRYALVSLFGIGQEDNDGNDGNDNGKNTMPKKENLNKPLNQSQNKTTDRKQGFLDSMKKLAAIDNESFVNLLGAAGYERAEDVPEESFAKVYKQIKEAMDKIKADF